MAIASGTIKSTLNPNASPFIPAAFQVVEDFSPEWWRLVKTSTSFHEHWLRQHEEMLVEGDSILDDVANLLPDSFELESEDKLINPDETDTLLVEGDSILDDVANLLPDSFELESKDKLISPDETDTLQIDRPAIYTPKNKSNADIIGSVLKNGSFRYQRKCSYAKQWEKPAQVFRYKISTGHIIQQPH